MLWLLAVHSTSWSMIISTTSTTRLLLDSSSWVESSLGCSSLYLPPCAANSSGDLHLRLLTLFWSLVGQIVPLKTSKEEGRSSVCLLLSQGPFESGLPFLRDLELEEAFSKCKSKKVLRHWRNPLLHNQRFISRTEKPLPGNLQPNSGGWSSRSVAYSHRHSPSQKKRSNWSRKLQTNFEFAIPE